jgi:eukaryotic-like serine/threonine-protein kinase
LSDTQDRLAAALADRYVLERELGRGGMATVYLARDLKHDRKVAIKVLHPELAATVGPERFQREIRTTARLQHPHILPVLDSGAAGGQLWYAMTYVEGESLRDRLRRERQLSLDDALQISREVADALGYAHSQGVVHRDIKPENILLSHGHALVADFGIARALDTTDHDHLTETGISLGTPAYMSPEQSLGDSTLDGRSDLYSLGCVLYEMLTGEPPYVGHSPQAITAKRLLDPIPSVRRLRDTVPVELDDVLRRVLGKAPADRFATADAFTRSLVGASSHTGLAPIPAGPSRRLARFGIAVIALAVVLGSVVAFFARNRAKAGAVPADGQHVIAVLPLKNLGAPHDQYFADGLTEEITSRLAELPRLGVISRISADHYRDTAKPLRVIGRELGAQYILEGSVRWEKAANGSSRVRVTPQLIRVVDDRHLWAERYDAELADVFRVQGDIATQVASALGVALGVPERQALSERPTDNLQAYALYLQGRQASKAGPSEQAVQLYEQAIALDTTFALAYVALAHANHVLYSWRIDRTPARRARVEAALSHALRLQPGLAEAWRVQGRFYTEGLHDYEQALRALRIADSLRPNDADILEALGRVDIYQGRFTDAAVQFRRAIVLSPRDGDLRLELGRLLAWMRRYDEADRQLAEAVALDPDHPYFWRWQAYAARLRGDTAGERRVLRDAMSRLGIQKMLTSDEWSDFVITRDSSNWAQLRDVGLEAFDVDTGRYLTWQAEFARVRGLTQRAHTYADSVRRRHEADLPSRQNDSELHSALAEVYLMLGRDTDAIREAELAVQAAPLYKNYLDGMGVMQDLALTYTQTGRKKDAIRVLGQLLGMPSAVSIERLRVDPVWDPLRGEPAFQRLLEGETGPLTGPQVASP